MTVHVVYYFFDDKKSLLYIGRTYNLQERIRYFTRRTGITPVVGLCQRFTDFDCACAAERAAIRKHNPPLNKGARSSRGSYGKHFKLSEETKRRMSTAHTGKAKSEQTKKRMSKPKSPEHKAKLVQVLEKARLHRKYLLKEK